VYAGVSVGVTPTDFEASLPLKIHSSSVDTDTAVAARVSGHVTDSSFLHKSFISILVDFIHCGLSTIWRLH